MAGNERVSLTVIRRKRKGGHAAHHGGAWKIAYADFVTAMMAFFLLMWLLGSTTKGDRQGIADYFNTPLTVALAGGDYSGGATSVLPGGGPDITRAQIGDAKAAQSASQRGKASADDAAAKKRRDGEELRRLRALKTRIESLIDRNPKLKPFSDQIKIDITSEGLRIQIVDSQNRPMFATGSTRLQPYTHDILREIGVALNDVDNRVSIAGHTDAAPYSGGAAGYSNWELSSERANAARRELIAGGMNERKIIQVRGLADALPLDPADPLAPMNRRISIVVLNRQTEAGFMRDRGRVDVNTSQEASDAIAASAAANTGTYAATNAATSTATHPLTKPVTSAANDAVSKPGAQAPAAVASSTVATAAKPAAH
ncbi:flagellar motor protein MotB [Chitinasiproducens palmae]|uniref:Chemotaxis protein MotB n=1 Tax=Chitinasiproducens palmae TaxID=1770053 RepID=A0A1H2PKX2_9BURK|nr:flagellar motor protein MotB [Chitinasiproducens palmae]SDV46666.1 chemotaxis protein MotB [Chitinasiproducens palmae]